MFLIFFGLIFKLNFFIWDGLKVRKIMILIISKNWGKIFRVRGIVVLIVGIVNMRWFFKVILIFRLGNRNLILFLGIFL